jgi:uncharacterized protein with NAD-binding domain and iron-sulfur cluster
MGFYDNAFRLIRECYDERRKYDPSVPDWLDAFLKQDQISFAEKDPVTGVWTPWNIKASVWPGLPGDDKPPGLIHLLGRLLDWLLDRHRDAGLHRTRPFAHAAVWTARQLARVPTPIPNRHKPLFLGLIGWLMRKASRLLDAVITDLTSHDSHLGLLLRLGYAVATGFINDVLPYGADGFSRINKYDLREWLMLNGASHDDAWSPPIKSMYDMGFSYVDGDSSDPAKAQTAAGVALNVMLLMGLGCRGSLLWKMLGGMGDVVFLPLYEVLRRRGVKFEFFHRVDNVVPSPDGSSVLRVEMTRQVDLVAGRDSEYLPLRNVTGSTGLCWPVEPLWDQIVDGERIRAQLAAQGITLESAWCDIQAASDPRVTLEAGRDFDVAVLAMSVVPLATVCNDIVQQKPRWQAMLATTKTVQTQSLQLWMLPSISELGWPYGPTVLISYTEPFDSWGEMSHLVPLEKWPKSQNVQAIEYFCGAMPDEPGDSYRDPGFPRMMKAKVFSNATSWLDGSIGAFWPDAVTGEKNVERMKWSLLADLSDAKGISRLDAQYARANIDPSERYVLAVPNSIAQRLHASDTGYSNLFLAGDFVVTRLNAGAFEAAVEGGLRAANGITGGDVRILGVTADKY